MATITCTACSGTGLLNAVTCTTCGGTGIVTVDITGIDPDSITGDSDVDLDPSDYSAFLFVPKNDGGNDKTTPGVLLRLGGYCDIESSATTETKATTLYPEEFVSSASDKTKAYEEASGSTTKKGGILLSCDGHLLVKACEKAFLHSDGELTIESGSTITIRSNQNSGKENYIIMDDTDGSMKIRTQKTTKEHFGNDIEFTKGNSASYTKGNIVGFTEGSKTFVTYGSSNSLYIGAGFDLKAAATLSISLALNFKCDFALNFSLAAVGCDFTLFKFSKEEVKVDKTKVKVDQNIVDLTNALTKLENNSVNLANQNLNLARRNFDLLQSQIDVNKKNISVNSAEMNANRATLLHLYL